MSGGRVYATHRDLGEHDWGTVTVWEPGRRLVRTFTLGAGSGVPSEVAVEFVAEGAAAAATVRARYTAAGRRTNVGARVKFGDWPLMLAAVRGAGRLEQPAVR